MSCCLNIPAAPMSRVASRRGQAAQHTERAGLLVPQHRPAALVSIVAQQYSPCTKAKPGGVLRMNIIEFLFAWLSELLDSPEAGSN